MQINITGRHFDVTPALESYVGKKMDKILRHFEHITSINVICGIDNLDQTIEATINIPGNQLFASTTADDMYKAVDLLVDKLDRQVIKTKEKMNDHRGG